MPTTLHTADMLCPLSGPPLAGGGVLADAEADDVLAAVARALARPARGLLAARGAVVVCNPRAPGGPPLAELAGAGVGVALAAAGRQVLTVVTGVRRARRRGADEPRPSVADHRYEEA